MSNIECYLSGGGNDIFLILNKIKDLFHNKKISYMVIAAENDKELIKYFQNSKKSLEEFFNKLGAVSFDYVYSQNILDILDSEILIISGGDTAYLLEQLTILNFIDILQHSSLEQIIGISAGVIALSKHGIGTLNGELFNYAGLNLLDVNIVPHSDINKQRMFPSYLHIRDYEWLHFTLSKKSHT